MVSLALLPGFGPKPAIHRRALAREATSFYGERILLRGQFLGRSADISGEAAVAAAVGAALEPFSLKRCGYPYR